MPSYDYRCQGCDSYFTVERSMTDSSETSCPHCQSAKVSRIWNMFIRAGGTTPDVGQGTRKEASGGGGHGCGSCSSHSCGTCH
ncbi:MAG: zinc ribbon domain-containing protein [Candidatus Melainabacteria bacterium]|uniref:Zinc ribbon domain-containing protein n=1 Tax=Candidatus Obscuribacter phosphatis TaxID=1906157 RepID=A0A8J7PEH1_9BACT|nr:zinc ribbon domain-containing protein [Candidatus Obscuribacter phosphatis]MCA0312569.1 zinc ribbon domain-containing protein [Candidatus Melainabacteria bacterium]OPZ84645.1 MAG: Zinc ribbon domain protein [bacterium ADurb.Bin425]